MQPAFLVFNQGPKLVGDVRWVLFFWVGKACGI